MMKALIKSALNQVKTEADLKKSTREILEKSRNTCAQKEVGWQMKKYVLAACAFILLCGLSVGGYFYYHTPVNYLSLDINPSVELGINAFDKVVSATGYNADGATILKGQDVTNSSVQDAVKDLVLSAAKNGFINSDGSTIISLTAETNDPETASDLEESSGQGAQEATSSAHVTAVVFKTNIALARRDEARKLGITPGKLNLIQKLQALDATATVDEYKDAKVTDIMKKIVELKKSAKSSDSDSSDSGLNNIENAVAQAEKDQEQETGKGTEQVQTQKAGGNSGSSDSVKGKSKQSGPKNGNSPASSASGNESSSIGSNESSSEVNSEQSLTSAQNENSDHGSTSVPSKAQSGKEASIGQNKGKSSGKGK